MIVHGVPLAGHRAPRYQVANVLGSRKAFIVPVAVAAAAGLVSSIDGHCIALWGCVDTFSVASDE